MGNCFSRGTARVHTLSDSAVATPKSNSSGKTIASPVVVSISVQEADATPRSALAVDSEQTAAKECGKPADAENKDIPNSSLGSLYSAGRGGARSDVGATRSTLSSPDKKPSGHTFSNVTDVVDTRVSSTTIEPVAGAPTHIESSGAIDEAELEGGPPLITLDSITDRYFLDSTKVGSGSFGEVYQAWRKLPRREGENAEAYERRCRAGPSFAIKRMKPTNPKVQEAIQRLATASTGVIRAQKKLVGLARRSRASNDNTSPADAGSPKATTPKAAATAPDLRDLDDDIAEVAPALETLLVKDRAAMHKEAELMKRVKGHEHVISIVDHCDDGVCVYIVMPYCAGGDMMKYISRCHHFSEKVAAYLFRQMLLAVAHCHTRGIVHRDLKPEQFLFVSSVGKAQLKLTDFGLAETIEDENTILTDAVGSAYFIAPEVFRKRYTCACDAWSLGVNLYLLLSGAVPFGSNAKTAKEVYKAIKHDELQFKGAAWAKISAEARELVAGLLEKVPYKRYNIAQALEHPWVNGDAPDVPLDKSVISAMYKFNARNKFRREALRIIASTLRAPDLRKLKTAFFEMDTDADKTISVAELSKALHSLGFTTAEAAVHDIMLAVDVDKDGKINLEEFLAATTELQVLHYQQEMWAAFNAVDKDRDGFIDLSEAKEIMGNEAEEIIRHYILEYDKDGDGKINYEEFVAMLIPKDMKFEFVTVAPQPA